MKWLTGFVLVVISCAFLGGLGGLWAVPLCAAAVGGGFLMGANVP